MGDSNGGSRLLSFPAYQLLVLEERLRERHEAGELPPEMDPTDFAQGSWSLPS
jgi:hypothetical protein